MLLESFLYKMGSQKHQRINKIYPQKSKKKSISWWKRIFNHFVSCANICSIHGFNHIVRKNISPYERLLWFLLVASATGWCIELSLNAWNHYLTRPTVISLERDHWKWNTTFPAVTLCLQGINDDRAEELIAELNISEAAGSNFKAFLSALANVNVEAFKNFGEYMNDSVYQDADNYLNWVLRTGLTLDYPVEIGQSFGELHEFQTILTEFGLCFAYNSGIAIYNSPEYWAKRTDKLVNGNSSIIMINPSIPAPALSIRSLSSDYKIFFHGPNEITEMSTRGMTVPQATFANFELSIKSVWTPSEVQNLRVVQRNCRLTYESNLKHSPVYSYNLCRANCRRHICYQLCHCVPYYYGPTDKGVTCNLTGMRCLYDHKDVIISLRNNSCTCIQNCDTDSITITKYEITDWFLGTNVQWKIMHCPTIRFKRSLIFSSTSAFVQIGGTAGLFLGCSILSLIELLYFFTLRLYWGVIRKRIIE